MPTNVSSLLIDSLNLPRFSSIDDLAKLIGLSSRLLYCLSMRADKYYKVKKIPKRNGSMRNLAIPSFTLHIVQRWILVQILQKILPSNRAMAFRRGNKFGHKQNAIYHSHTLYGLSLDIKDFFPSITANKVFTVFSNLGYNNFASTILTNLCTLDGKLPQGSASSPALSNLVCITLDKRLIGLCEKRGIRFTRYADDMYFSCDDKSLLLKNFCVIKKIINNEGFILNDSKTHYVTPANRRMITGITITTSGEDKIEIKAPKELKKKIRAEIFKCIVSGTYENKDHILGEVSYVNFIEHENSIDYMTRLKKYICSVGGKILLFPELVDAYNNNRFYNDLDILEPIPIKNFLDGEEFDDDILYQHFDKRQKYLLSNELNDICTYSDWPDEYLNNTNDGIANIEIEL